MRRGCPVGGSLVGGYTRGVRGGRARGNHARGGYVRGGRARASGRTVGIATELLVGLLGHVYPHPFAYMGGNAFALALLLPHDSSATCRTDE